MPVSRSPVRSVSGIPYHGHPASTRGMHIEVNNSAAQYNSLLSPHAVPGSIPAPPSVSPPTRKRRTPNAFILYRSYIIANKLYPMELNRQSDVSRYVAAMWRVMSEPKRSVFFKMAEDEKRRVQLESPDKKPYKERRLGSRKASSPRNNSLRGGLSPASTESCPLPTSSMSVSSSPPSISPTFSPLPLPLHDASASLLIPQPIHAIPPHLLNWDQEMDSNESDGVRSNELESTWPSSHLSMPLQMPYHSDITFFDSLDAEMLTFQLSTDIYTDFTSSFPDTPPFGVYLPA